MKYSRWWGHREHTSHSKFVNKLTPRVVLLSIYFPSSEPINVEVLSLPTVCPNMFLNIYLCHIVNRTQHPR